MADPARHGGEPGLHADERTAPAEGPFAAARIVGADLLSLRTVEVRLALWPLQPGWIVVPPVKSDLRLPDLPRYLQPEIEWREIAPVAGRAERLFLWRAHLPRPAWQLLPMRLQIDSLWLRPVDAPIESRAVQVRGPWIFELNVPEAGTTAPARPAPRLTPSARSVRPPR